MGAGTLKQKQSTRLALSSPVAVGAGATVGLLVHAAEGDVYFSRKGEAGAVDASDGAISVLKGRNTVKAEPFAEVDDYYPPDEARAQARRATALPPAAALRGRV